MLTFFQRREDTARLSLRDPRYPGTLLRRRHLTQINWASARFRNCLEFHGGCKVQSDIILPKRILDLGPAAEDGSFPFLRLYETSRESAPYACLSHCWGTSQPVQTTKASLSAFKKNIDWCSLPKTFRDAVQVANALGL
jgi:hypothetical protein